MPYQKRFLKEFSRRPEDAGQAQKFAATGHVNAMDVLQFQGSNLIGGILNETLRLVPEYSGENPIFGNTIAVPARSIAGTRYETLVRTEIPRGGFFRDFNEPVGNKKASREKREFEMFPFMGFWEADEQLLKVALDGGAALMQDDAQAVLSGLVMDLGEYFYYGKTNPESQKAFPGLIQQMPDNRTRSAGGTGSNLTSIYFAWLDPSLQGVSWIHGNSGVIQTSAPTVRVSDTGSGLKKKIVEQSIEGFMGLQVLHSKSVYRIANIDISSAFATNPNTSVVTDELLGAAKMHFLTHQIPNLVAFMRPETFRLWRASKLPLSDTGFQPPISDFANFEGIKVVVTESIKKNEGQV